jgi:hypothetical protein
MIINIILSIFTIVALIYIYRKYKTESEELVVLKLIGYCILGAFKASINSFAVPVGFVIYAILFRPKKNTIMKRTAAFLGLLIFIISLLTPKVNQAYSQRERTFAASSSNIYTLELKEDFNAIKQMFKVSAVSKIEDFNVSFEDSGSIMDLRYTFYVRKERGITQYSVYLSQGKNKYIIRPLRTKMWSNYDFLISEEQFFHAFEGLDIEKLKTQDEYPFYTIRSSGDIMSFSTNEMDKYLITEEGLKEIKEEDLPVSGYGFWIFGNKRDSENSYSSDKSKFYILPVHR